MGEGGDEGYWDGGADEDIVNMDKVRAGNDDWGNHPDGEDVNKDKTRKSKKLKLRGNPRQRVGQILMHLIDKL